MYHNFITLLCNYCVLKMATRQKGYVETALININININYISYTKPLTYFTYIWKNIAYEKKKFIEITYMQTKMILKMRMSVVYFVMKENIHVTQKLANKSFVHHLLMIPETAKY